MTLGQKLDKFLQVDNLVCANDNKSLYKKWGYLKLKVWPQYPLGYWRWWKQFFEGDTFVLRFCDEKCFGEWKAKQTAQG